LGQVRLKRMAGPSGGRPGTSALAGGAENAQGTGPCATRETGAVRAISTAPWRLAVDN